MNERVDEMKGSVKKGFGKLTGNERLEAEGGREAAAAKAKRETKGALRKAGGTVKEGIGKLTGDEVTEAEGKAERLRGHSEQAG